MPTQGAIFSYVQYASRVATNGARIYHLGSTIPIMFNEMNLRGVHLIDMMDQERVRPFTAFALLLGRSADGKSTSAMTAVKHIIGVLDEADRQDSTKWVPQRALEFDGTPEGLRYKLVSECFNPEREETVALVYHEEFTTIFQRSHGAVTEFLLRMYDGRDLNEAQRQHQKAQTDGGASHGIVKAPKINGLFCSTPDYLAKTVSQAMASGGLYGRLLIFSGEERRQPYEGDYVSDTKLLEERARWKDRNVTDLLEWSQFLDDVAGLGGQLSISPEAHDVFKARHAMYQDLVKAGKFDDNLRAMIGRATRTAWMLGALYATTRYEVQVSADDARRAVKLVDQCFTMGEDLSTMFEASDTAKRHKAVLQAVTKAGVQGIVKSDIHKAPGIKNKGIRKIELQDAIDTLEEGEFITKVVLKTKGRNCTIYYLPEHAPPAVSESN